MFRYARLIHQRKRPAEEKVRTRWMGRELGEGTGRVRRATERQAGRWDRGRERERVPIRLR